MKKTHALARDGWSARRRLRDKRAHTGSRGGHREDALGDSSAMLGQTYGMENPGETTARLARDQGLIWAAAQSCGPKTGTGCSPRPDSTVLGPKVDRKWVGWVGLGSLGAPWLAASGFDNL